MMYFFLLCCWILLIAYAWVILRRWYTWLKMPIVRKTSAVPTTLISVLIPVRNEEMHLLALLQDLELQTYPKDKFEVIIIDDHSDDRTAELAIEFKKKCDLTLLLIRLQDYAGLRQKKAAVSTGITFSKGELIVQTDGDCRVTPDWLYTLAQFYEQTKAVCISGPVSFLPDNSIFTGLQIVEFASLIGIGGASIALGKPNMSNGANIAYQRQAFLEVQGFSGNEHIASGDDEFLMHKLAKRYPGKIYFLKSPAAIVSTAAQKTIQAFINQRIRWASKWPNYSDWKIKLLAILVFAVNLCLFLNLISWLYCETSDSQLIYIYAFKFLVDGLFLYTILHFLNRSKYIIFLIPLQLVYIPYVLYTALRGLQGTYQWKGRQVKN